MKSTSIAIHNSNGILRGAVHQPNEQSKGCIICLHGGPNGDLHGNTNIFDQLAEVVVRLGLTVIQFSFFGAQPSDGEPKSISLRTQIDDYRSVIRYAVEHFGGPVHVVGESAGATVASQSWEDGVTSYVFLWPAFDLRDTDLRNYLNAKWWDQVNRDGYLNDNGLIIGKELFSEILLTDFNSGFHIPAVPALIVHGRNDNEVPIAQSLKALTLSKSSTGFFAIEGGDHGCKGTSERNAVLQVLSYWFSQQLK